MTGTTPPPVAPPPEPGHPDLPGPDAAHPPRSAVETLVRSLPPGDLPAYVYDLAALRDHAARVRTALGDRVELYYAAKANPDPAILRALSPWTDGYEVASGGELDAVAAAVPGRPLAFGGPGRTPEETTAALRRGVPLFHVESARDLRQLSALADEIRPGGAPPAGVLLRVNLPVAGGLPATSALAMGGSPSPFGSDPAETEDLLRELTGGGHPGLRWRGVHAHLASGLTASEHLAIARSVVDWSAALAARHGLPLPEVNVGGGMAVDYTRPGDRFDWAALGAGLTRLADEHPGTVLRIEPGRALTAYCGWYATEVIDVKRSHGETFAVLRGGTHHLRTPATRGHAQPHTVLPVDDWPHPWPRPTAPADGPVTLTGQLCTPKDVLARAVSAPGLRAGDRVVFALAGAYAWNISHHDFLMHPKPGFHHIGAEPEDGPAVP
ncbi:type III PLP-dependent enzyme [Streptomyces sp. NPDC020875]|uniref:type III PLP-dependent enzyme n=1 Tax=Streptomyces sp. NPDC020875 TaxID=3154898 RepID=UPI0033C38230